jgi:hypothetical protein
LSLILEALKKLDREKQAPDRGLLVVGAVPWPAPRTRRWRPVLLAVAVAAAAGTAVWFTSRGRRHDEAPRSIVPPSTPAAPVVAAPVTVAPAPVRLPAPMERPIGEAEATPTRPAPVKPDADAPPDRGLQLQAIGERDGRPVAVISSRLVREGDRYDGITIVRIGADEVEIEVQGQRRTLRF